MPGSSKINASFVSFSFSSYIYIGSKYDSRSGAREDAATRAWSREEAGRKLGHADDAPAISVTL